MKPELLAAVTSGNVKSLAELQVSCNILQEVMPKGDTALHLAAYHGHVKVVNMLLQLMDADVEQGNQAGGEFLMSRNEKGNTAFHEAAIGGHQKVIEVLLDRNRDLQNIINDAGETALFKAAEEGHEKIVIKLLPSTLPLYDRRTSDGQTLVQCAVYNRRKEVLKKLIDAKPDLLQTVDNLLRTPLHYAAYLKRISDIAKIILENDRSSCYKVDSNRQLALHIAVKEGNIDLVREILKYAKDCIVIGDNEGRNALHLVIENPVQIFDKIGRRLKTLMFLVISKRLINEADNRGKTPLDIALDNMDRDERLFEGIIWLLKINGARRKTPKETHDSSEHSFTTEKSMWKVQIISVNAVLIAAAAFQAAFTLPSFITLPKEHKEKKLYDVFLQFSVICVALAFCSSTSSAVLLMYALYGEQEDPLLLDTSVTALWIALISFLLAFGGGIFLAVAPDHATVSVIVLGMVMIVPIWIRIMILRSKKYILRPDENYLRILIISVVFQITLIISVVLQFRVFYFVVIILFIVMMMAFVVLIGRRRYLRSKETISRGDWHYIWIFLWYWISTFTCMGAYSNFLTIIWLIAGVGACIARRIYFQSKQKNFRDDNYIGVLAFLIGVSTNSISRGVHV